MQPVLWLVVFGQVFARTIPTGGFRYLDFMAPGVLAQSDLSARDDASSINPLTYQVDAFAVSDDPPRAS